MTVSKVKPRKAAQSKQILKSARRLVKPRIIALCNGKYGCITDKAMLRLGYSNIQPVSCDAKDIARIRSRWLPRCIDPLHQEWIDTKLDAYNVRYYDGQRTWRNSEADIRHTFANITEPTVVGITLNRRTNQSKKYKCYQKNTPASKKFYSEKVESCIPSNLVVTELYIDDLYHDMFHMQVRVEPQ